MRYGVIAFAALVGLPALSQSDSAPKNQGIVNERAMREAVRGAMQKALRAPPIVPLPNLPAILPLRTVVINLPPVMCAVPLVEIPISRDVDKGILRPESAVSRDDKILVPPALPSCADIQNR